MKDSANMLKAELKTSVSLSLVEAVLHTEKNMGESEIEVLFECYMYSIQKYSHDPTQKVLQTLFVILYGVQAVLTVKKSSHV